MPKFYVTKYALGSGGIFAIESEEPEGRLLKDTRPYGTYFHGEGNDWHRTAEAAIARAEEMRVKKLASLRKQLAKLEKRDLTKVRDFTKKPAPGAQGEG